MSLSIQNISKAFGANIILNDFSLDIADGTRLCVCGPNGCGKTTLLKILAGAEQPDNGKIGIPRTARLGYVQQELSEADLENVLLDWVLEVLPDWNDFWHEWEQAHHNNDTQKMEKLAARQAELERLYGYNPEHRARAVLSGLGFKEKKFSRTLGQLSGGWRERAKLARVLTAGADILLLDEPTNHLDLDAVEWLEKFITSFEGVLVFVAHDLVFMDNVSTHVLYLGGSKPIFRKGNFTKFLEVQEQLEEQREREAKKLSDDIDRKLDFVRRFRAKANKARQAISRQKMARKLEKELENYRPEPKRRELDFKWPEPERCDNNVLTATDLSYAFPDNGKVQFSGFSFNIYRGQRLAIVGANGCGKTTLLRVIAGVREASGGTLSRGSGVRLGYFSQHQLETLNPENTVLAEITRLSDPRTTREELMSVLGLFLLGQNYFERKVESLSGGEKSRLCLAALFLARCNFLVLDEPTNHLDLESRETLIEAMENFTGTVLMVAHDRHLLARAAEQVWEYTPEGFRVHLGGYEEYARKRAEADNPARPAGAGEPERLKENPAPAARPSLNREELKALRREQAELRNKLSREYKPHQDAYARRESELEKLLSRQSEVESELALPEVYADRERTATLLEEFSGLGTKIEQVMEEMEKLEGILAEFEAKRQELEQMTA
ncbi:MAG: ATP-binding cassette domain-containing protein [Desulfovibrionaceae bacterium]|nr:ATP-binding cassette domain-containing protein [Desulfovibrionaceae bacterium]